jgi:hypothetical protein
MDGVLEADPDCRSPAWGTRLKAGSGLKESTSLEPLSAFLMRVSPRIGVAV